MSRANRWMASAIALALMLVPLPGASSAESLSGLGEEGTQPLIPRFERAPASLLALPQGSAVVIDGARGGRVQAGRFTIDVPPGAFRGSATVTIVVANPHVLRCSLNMLPEVAAFDVPVRLTVDGAGCDNKKVKDWALINFDTKEIKWKKHNEAAVDDKAQKLTAELPHFSDWGVVDNKAGW